MVQRLEKDVLGFCCYLYPQLCLRPNGGFGELDVVTAAAIGRELGSI